MPLNHCTADGAETDIQADNAILHGAGAAAVTWT